MGRLDGKVAMVTGGAAGIGKATATLFAKEGAKVIVADIQEAAARKTVDEIRQNNGEAIYIHLDVSQEAAWQKAMEEVIHTYGKLNILVNNAGISLAKDIVDTTLEDWNRIMTVNSTGVFLGTKYGILTMRDNGELCSIINRSSIDGQIAEPGLFAYCASKGAVTIMSKSATLACGERKYTIRVNTVHPGYVHTELTEEEARGYGLTPDEYFKKVGAQHPIGCIGEPMDVAYLDLYLASDESKWVTGAEFTVDGGWTAQ